MESFEQYKKRWVIIDEYEYSKIELVKLDERLLIEPINSFPPEIVLTDYELKQLSDLEKQKGWSGEEFYKMQQLQYRRGISQNSFQHYSDSFQQILEESKKINISVPTWFKYLFSSYKTLKRFRFGDIHFRIFEGIIPFPEFDNFYLIPFLGDSQGFCWWSILIDKASNYRIVYRDLHWREYPTEEYGEYFICSNSFEEFLVRLSIDSISKENKKAANIR